MTQGRKRRETVMILNRLWLACGVIILLCIQPGEATLVPTLDLDRLTADATLIVVGQIMSVQEMEKTTVPFGNRAVAARAMVAELRVDQVLKGITDDSASSLKLHFTLPDEFIGWRSVPTLSYRIFFLKESAGQLELASPYYPSFVAIPGVTFQGNTATERVVAELGAVLESTEASLQEKQEAIYALDSSKDPTVVPLLRRSAEVKDATLRLSAAAALLGRNDISTLPFAVDALLKPSSSNPADLLHNLSAAIFLGVRDDRAVPELMRLLRAPGAETRRAGAAALMRTGTKSCIDPLLSAISDSDVQVRYYSAVGLAEITGQMDWRPNMDDFTSNERKYLQHWSEWAQSR
jgi:HEAT repeat protein